MVNIDVRCDRYEVFHFLLDLHVVGGDGLFVGEDSLLHA